MFELITRVRTDYDHIAGVLQGTVTPDQCAEIASLSIVERDRRISDLMNEATSAKFVVRGIEQRARLFFIPVIVAPNDNATSLITRFHGAKQVADALSKAGLGQLQQNVRLIPKLYEHEEVAHWSTGDLQTMLHMIMTLNEDRIRRFPKRSEVAETHESTPLLSYLIGAVFGPVSDSPFLTVKDWSYASAVTANLLSLQDGGSQSKPLPAVLRPMEYKEALIEGTIASVEVTRQFLQDEVFEEDDELTTDFIFAPSGSPCVYLDGAKTTAMFQMDAHRLGHEGVQRVMGRVNNNDAWAMNKNVCH